MESTFIEVLNFGVSVQAYLHFVAHAVNINVNDGGGLENKIAFEERYHGTQK